MKRVIVLFIFLVIVVGLIIILNNISKQGAPQTPPTPPPDQTNQTLPSPVTIRIGYPKKGLILNHYGETISKTNILEKNQLIASINALDDESAVLNALINKSIDVGFLSEFQAVLALGADFNGVLIANLGSLGRVSLMVLFHDSPIQKITDLKNKKIALTFNTTEHQALLGWLKRELLEVDKDVTLINVEEAQKLTALKNGQVNALVTTDPIVESYSRQNLCRRIYDSHKYGVVLLSKDFWIKEQKASIRFINALKESTLFLSTHKMDVNNWIKGYCGIEEDLIWGCSGINIGYQSTQQINQVKLFFSDVSINGLINIVAFASKQKLINKTFSITDVITQETQDELKKEIDPKKYDPHNIKILK
jgi:ABC-type nitrate/sulfonate/bicarbonate transport system substrate-binding protein